MSSDAPAMDGANRRHGRRLAVLMAVLTAVAFPLVVFVWGPHLPPHGMSTQSRDQHATNVLLAAVATPIVVIVLSYFGYALVVFRRRGDDAADGAPLFGNPRVQASWIAITATLVLLAAVWGSIGLVGSAAGAGGGQGPVPLSVPAGTKLQVQVIGQQWAFTYRYPSYHGVETTELALPVGVTAEIHVTSLDVVHSWWAYQLGLKADAVPGEDNVVFVTPRHTGTFQVRCSELCGLWHAQMTNQGQVLSSSDFAHWISGQVSEAAPVLKYLPPYAKTYVPSPGARAG